MSKNEKKIEIKIEGKEWQDCLDKAFEKNNKKAKIDGFRPGKAPKSVFIKKYGLESLFMDAADIAIQVAYEKMLKDNKDVIENLVARPDINISSIDKDSITLSFTLTLRPEVKLGKYTDLGVKKEKPKATKEEIEESINSMRNRYAENIIKEGKIEAGDIAVINFEGFVDGKAFEGGKGENYSLKIGSGTFIPGFEDQLIGLKALDEKDVKVTFPKDYHAEDLKGKEATFKVKVIEVKEVSVPKLDKDFFDDLGMEGITNKEELEKTVKENILARKEMECENKYLDELLEAAAKNTKVDVPEVMITEELDRMIKDYSDHLRMQGISLEQFYQFTNSDEDALKNQMREEANKRVVYRLMLEEIAKKEKIEISDKEAKEEVKKLAEKYGVSEEEFLMNFGGLDIVKYDLRMRKAMDVLKG
ncbi:MAG: trigger factor [Bacilli bacterium]|nr:trigger factor [Bacilli bacterium]MBR3209315.1 trigger factor [Bacilli bacterium]